VDGVNYTLEGAIFVKGEYRDIPFTHVLSEIEAEALFLDTGFSKGEKRVVTMYELPTLYVSKKFVTYSFGYVPVKKETEMIKLLGLSSSPIFGDANCSLSGYYGTGSFAGGVNPDRALYWYDLYVYSIKKKISIVCFPPVRYPNITNIRNTFVYFDFFRGIYVAKAGTKLMENGQYYELKQDLRLGEVG
jgi:hypothetical protein